jgi:hypothetical protein
MASNFVPLQPVGPSVVRRSAAAPAKSASSPKDHPAPPNFAPLCAASPGTDDAHLPVITLKKEGDRVVQIRVQCVCGQIIDLACDY